MKAQNMISIRNIVAAATLMISTAASALPSCKASLFGNDSVTDLTSFNSDLMKQVETERQTGKCDTRREIKPSQNSNEAAHQLNAIGKVTIPTEGVDVRKKEVTAWQSGFMISPCHMITTYHGAISKEDKENASFKDANMIGKKLNFSFFSTGTDFQYRKEMTIAATGEYKISGQSSAEDWVISNLNDGSDIKEMTYLPPSLTLESTKIDEKFVGLTAGFPMARLNSEQDSAKIYGTKQIYQMSQYGFVSGNATLTRGDSGGATLSWDKKNEMYVARALNAGGSTGSISIKNGKEVITEDERENGKSISLDLVLTQLKQRNPVLYKKVMESAMTGKCVK